MRTDLFDNRPHERKPPSAVLETVPGPRLIEDLVSFGWLKNDQNRAVMLEIRHANGLIRAYNYGWLESAEFDPSEGITLNFSGTKVKLIGRNLNTDAKPGIRLFEGILRHRVIWIQESDEEMESESLESDVVIEQVVLN